MLKHLTRMSAPPDSRVYRSIFLANDWAHQKYLGWSVVADEPGLRILKKQRAVARRYLMLLTQRGETRLAGWVSRAIDLAGFSEVIIHDFEGVLAGPPSIAGRKFRLAGQRERLLNTSTFVIDLTQPLDALWRNMGDKSRNMVRKAQQLGVKSCRAVDVKETVDAFSRYYEQVAKRYKVSHLGDDCLLFMAKQGDLEMFVCRDANSNIVNVNMVYVVGNQAYCMFIANHDRMPTGCGQFSQWKIIEMLKAAGVEWYDLGGAGEKEVENTVFKFKKSIGGTYHDLGNEYVHRGAALNIVSSILLRK
jgi:hypothetical protein